MSPNPSIEGTSTSGLRPLAAAPHVKRYVALERAGECLRHYLEQELPGSPIEGTVHCMKTLKVNLPEPTVNRLEEAARRLKVSLDDLLRMSVEEKLARVDDSYLDAVELVVSKNAELYKRLS